MSKLIESELKSAGTLAIQDDYKWWAAHGEASTAGKLLFVPVTNDDEHHIFFDDNVYHNEVRYFRTPTHAASPLIYIIFKQIVCLSGWISVH